MEFFAETASQKAFQITSTSHLLCESADNSQIFTEEKISSLNSYIKNINTTLSNGKGNMKAALAKLLTFLPQCPQSVITAEGERWIRLCFQRLPHDDSSISKSLFAILTILFRSCHENKELSNKVTKLNVNFIEKLYIVDVEVRESSFKCLYEFLRLFPSQSLPYKKKIEQKLMTVLSLTMSSKDTVYCAGQVYAALPVPGGSHSTADVKGSHLDQLISLCHCAADALFHSVKENETYDFTLQHKLPVKSLEDILELDPFARLVKAAPLLGNCFIFLKAFLEKCTFKVTKIKAKELVRLAFRILQVEAAVLRDNASMELTVLSFILPSLHTRAVGLLKHLVENKVCERFMNVVEEQLVSTLKGCNSFIASKTKSGEVSSKQSRLQRNRLLRILCYETLTEAVKVSNGSSQGLLEGLISNLMKDISPIKDSLSLKSAVRGGKLSLMSVKKKSKKKGYTVTSEENKAHETEIPQSQIVHQRIPVTVAALELVEAIFLNAQHSNNVKYIKILQDHLLLLLNTLPKGVFNDPQVRARLFSAVSALVSYQNPYCPPDYCTITDAFKREFQQNSHPKVKEVCTRGLATLSCIMANPNIPNLSEVVKLKKECSKLELKLNEEDEEPTLINGQKDHEEEESDEDQCNESKMDEDDDETSSANEDDDEEDHDIDNVVNGDEEDNDEDKEKKSTQENGEECEEEEEISEPDLESDNDLVGDDEDEDFNNSSDESDEDEMSENCNPMNDEDDEDEKESAPESDSDAEESSDSASRKRRSAEQSGNKYKKNKTDDKEGTSSGSGSNAPSVADMLSSLVQADPDSD